MGVERCLLTLFGRIGVRWGVCRVGVCRQSMFCALGSSGLGPSLWYRVWSFRAWGLLLEVGWGKPCLYFSIWDIANIQVACFFLCLGLPGWLPVWFRLLHSSSKQVPP